MQPLSIIIISIFTALLFVVMQSESQQISTTILEITFIVLLAVTAIAIEHFDREK